MEDNTRNPIDELFRNKLNEDQPVSENSLWEEVEGLMDKRKKKKRILLLMWTLLLIGTATTGYFLLPGKGAAEAFTVDTVQNPVSSQRSVNNQTVGTNSTRSNVAGANEGSGSALISTPSITSTQSKNAVSANDNLNTTSALNNNIVKTSSSVTARKSMGVSKKHKASTPGAQASTAAESQNGSVADKTINTGAKPDSTTNNSIVGANTINANTYLKGNLSSSDEELADTSAKKPVVAQSDELTKPKKPTHKSLMKWYVEVDGAYMDNIHLVGAPASVSPYYDNIRGSDERPLGTFNYMFKVGVVRKNLQFNSGLGITNVGEKVEYKNHNDTTGNSFIQNGSVFERNGSYVNEYLTVPFQVAYLIPLKGVRFQLGIGTAASMPLRWNSYYLNTQIDGLENPGSLKMVNNLVFNFNFTFGLEVPFTRHLTGVASFEFTRDLNNVFKSEYGIEQEYLGPGGSLGIRYSFAR